MSMKTLVLAAALVCAPVAHAYESRGVEKPPTLPKDSVVPRGHWTYEALSKLEPVRIDNVPLFDDLSKKELQRKLTDTETRLTRYEVALIMVHILGTLQEQPLIKTLTPTGSPLVWILPAQNITSTEPDFTPEELVDIIAALRREYADELAHFGVRDYDFLISTGRVAKPPRLKITPTIIHHPGTFVSTENFVSPTFDEILTRMTKRDEKTGAILTVKRKTDAPQNQATIANALPDLNFSITQTDDGKNVVITLSSQIGDVETVYERYILRLNVAMRRELNFQKLYQDAQKTASK